jgi:hypothetical protein
MAGIGWQAQLERASNEDAVAVICNEFLSTWTPEEFSSLPSSCRPCDVIEVEAIAPYAIRLIAALDLGTRSTAPLLYKMATFFTKAALRLVDVMEVDSRSLKRGRNSSSGSSSAEG